MHRLLPSIVILLGAMLWSCAAAVPVDEPDSVGGVYLYRKHCSRCHGVLSMTSKPGRRPARIKSAIRYNLGGMSSLSGLSDEDITTIADVLIMVSPPEKASGEELYISYCADCHRPPMESDIKGRGLTEIKAALSDVMCNTVSLEFLEDDDMAKVAGFLNAVGTDAGHAAGPETAGFEVARFLSCEGVIEREPVGVQSEFPAGVEKVYAFLEAREVSRNMYVHFVWYTGGVEAGRDRIKLGKGPRWRTYCFKSINGASGDWRVEVHGAGDVKLAEAGFKVGG